MPRPNIRCAEGGLILLALAPLLAVMRPPFIDYYGHLARVHVEGHIATFAGFYRLTGRLPPNLGFDLVLLGLTRFLPPLIAGWIFLVATELLLIGGLFALNRRLAGPQRCPVAPLAGLLLVYGFPLVTGFTAYLLALALMLWALWLWFGLRARRPLAAGGAAALAGLVLVFCHMLVFVVFALVVGAVELAAARQGRGAGRPAGRRLWSLLFGVLPLVPPAALLLLAFGAGEAGALTVWAGPVHKLWSLYAILDDGATPGFLLGLGCLAVAAAAATAAGGRASLVPAMRLPLAAVAAFFLAAPVAMAGGWFIDQRLPLPLYLLALAGLRLEPAPRRATLFLAVLAVVLAMHSAWLWSDFARFEAGLATATGAFEAMAPGGILATLEDRSRPGVPGRRGGPRFLHVGDLAVLRGRALVLTLWANGSQQMIAVEDRYRALYRAQDGVAWGAATPAELAPLIARYRALAASAASGAPGPGHPLYLYVLSPGDLADALARQGQVLGRSADFMLIRLAGT